MRGWLVGWLVGWVGGFPFALKINLCFVLVNMVEEIYRWQKGNVGHILLTDEGDRS